MSDNAGDDLAQIGNYLNNFIKKVEQGEGMNLTEEKKAQFLKEIKEPGAVAKMDELKNSIAKLGDLIKNKNATH